MAVFSSSEAKVLLPRNIGDGMITKAQSTSTVAKLSQQQPMRFGEVDYITFDSFPRAEFVEEGADKGHTTGGFGAVTAKPHKAQVTMRFNEEVQWAEEDYQLDILNQLSESGSVALSRALDLGIYHRINPLSGDEISGWDTYLTSTSKSVLSTSGEIDQVLRQAVGLVVNDDTNPVAPTGIALDPATVWSLGELQTKNADGSPSGVQRYPTIGIGTDMTSFFGIPVAVGNTVSGKPEATEATNVQAIIGDFRDGIRWGIQRNLPVEIIRFGDPDGQGDLRRKNQIALRLEIVYGWYVDPNRFAKVVSV